jgi:dTDP-glucose 4,6-dehydratase
MVKSASKNAAQKPKRVFVTGGAGFIGSHMVRRLLDEGCEVLNVDKLTYAGSTANLGEYFKHPKHHFEKADICNDSKIANLLNDFMPNAVLHMAAESHVDRSIAGPQVFIETNIIGTHNVLKAACDYWQTLKASEKDSFRFIHLSTDEVFGALGEKGFFNEQSPYQPNSPYAASKASSDLLARSYHRTYGFPAVIVNSSNNYGPNQYPEKLIPLMIANAVAGKPLPVYGDGKQIRDWLFVGDHVEGLWQVVNRGGPGQSYCIGGEHEIRNIELVRKLCAILDRKAPRADKKSYADLIKFVADRPGHDYRYATDTAKIKKELGWLPKMPFDKGLEETVGWYLQNKKGIAA